VTDFVTILIPRMVLRVPVVRKVQDGPDTLSGAERRVYGLLVLGKQSKEIANVLHCSVRTVKYHLTNIYRKCAVADRVEFLVRYGRVAEVIM